jgi:hypothetical protein
MIWKRNEPPVLQPGTEKRFKMETKLPKIGVQSISGFQIGDDGSVALKCTSESAADFVLQVGKEDVFSLLLTCLAALPKADTGLGGSGSVRTIKASRWEIGFSQEGNLVFAFQAAVGGQLGFVINPDQLAGIKTTIDMMANRNSAKLEKPQTLN